MKEFNVYCCMKTIYQKLFFVLFLLFMIMSFEYRDNIFDISSHFKMKQTKDYIVKVKTANQTLNIPLEEYLVGVIAGEMPVSFELEALKAQAVASRTFVLSRHLNVDNTTNSQVYLTTQQMQDKWGKNYLKNKQKIEKAIEQTKYKVMTYNNNYISALFFQAVMEKTVNCEDYFQGGKPYLKAVDSHWDQKYDPNYKRKKLYKTTTYINISNVLTKHINNIIYVKWLC